MQGGPVALAVFMGKPTVVNLWATWCPPCRREMPPLERTQLAHPELNFVFVNQGETRPDIERHLRSQGVALRNVLLDAWRATSAAFNQLAMPSTLFFDAQDRLARTRVGALSQATLGQGLRAIQVAMPAPDPARNAMIPRPRPQAKEARMRVEFICRIENMESDRLHNPLMRDAYDAQASVLLSTRNPPLEVTQTMNGEERYEFEDSSISDRGAHLNALIARMRDRWARSHPLNLAA
jgi:thiol-disulfide isomerase/thioredoxin